MEALTVADLTFEIRRSPRRKTIEIIVDRGGELVLAAPDGLALSVMTDFVEEKAFWIYCKLAEKEALQHAIRVREYVDGEGFSYLGRSYRLLLVDEQDSPVKLVGGRFRMRRSVAGQGRKEMVHGPRPDVAPEARRAVDWTHWRGAGRGGRPRVGVSVGLLRTLWRGELPLGHHPASRKHRGVCRGPRAGAPAGREPHPRVLASG